jgi:hypothetical protein
LDDPYHFNSLYFARQRLFVLAHNWWYGSFVLELAYAGAESFFREPRLIRAHSGLGNQSHDIYADRQSLYILDSGNARLLSSDGSSVILGPAQEGSHCFPRGLAVSRRFFYAGHGTFGTREERSTGPTQITVIDRKNLHIEAVLHIGPYGNPCDLLLVSEVDWSDTAKPMPRPGASWSPVGLLQRLASAFTPG